MTSATHPAEAGRVHGGIHWGWLMALGVLTAGVGLLLLFNLAAAARTLALLLALGLVLNGIIDLMRTDTGLPRWVPLVTGAVLIVGGILAAAWPDVTLWVVAVVIGVALLVEGAIRVVVGLSYRQQPGSGYTILTGALTVLVAILALAWPEATILVLSIILGVRILVIGIVEIAAALATRRMGEAQA